MSVNLEMSVSREGEDSVLLLTGFSRGITHSAMVSIGDTVIFKVGQRAVRVKINDVIHEWQPGGSRLAPVSTALGESPAVLTETEYECLLSMGFEEI
jgi:hypothetical protein